MCHVFGISRSGYYAWLNRRESETEKWRTTLKKEIMSIWEKSRKTYGSPRIQAELKKRGLNASRPTVARLMTSLGVKSKVVRKKAKTTISEPEHPKAPNYLMQDFKAYVPNQIWLSDITYISTNLGFLYLAAILDLCTRKIVGWSMDIHMKTSLVLNALNMAVVKYKPEPGLIYHSDQGSQYTSFQMSSEMKFLGFIQSMSRRGNCHDNSPMESFFHTLKTELVYHEKYESFAEVKHSIFEWIEVFYNTQRIHSSIDFKTPLEKEKEYMLEI